MNKIFNYCDYNKLYLSKGGFITYLDSNGFSYVGDDGESVIYSCCFDLVKYSYMFTEDEIINIVKMQITIIVFEICKKYYINELSSEDNKILCKFIDYSVSRFRTIESICGTQVDYYKPIFINGRYYVDKIPYVSTIKKLGFTPQYNGYILVSRYTYLAINGSRILGVLEGTHHDLGEGSSKFCILPIKQIAYYLLLLDGRLNLKMYFNIKDNFNVCLDSFDINVNKEFLEDTQLYKSSLLKRCTNIRWRECNGNKLLGYSNSGMTFINITLRGDMIDYCNIDIHGNRLINIYDLHEYYNDIQLDMHTIENIDVDSFISFIENNPSKLLSYVMKLPSNKIFLRKCNSDMVVRYLCNVL